MRKQRPTRRELARQRAENLFTGREDIVQAFQNNLKAPYDTRKLIWMIQGTGGVGKTTLLKRFRDLARTEGHVAAATDEYTPADIVSVMGSIAEQIERDGHKLERFGERYDTYRQLRHKMEAQPERPSGFATALGRAAGRLTLAAAKDLPGGNFTTELVGEEWIVDKAGELASWVASKVGNRDEVRLVLEPIAELTPLWVNDLCDLSARHAVSLFFDTYENTGSYLDQWLRDVLEGEKYGDIGPDVFVVIAGRDPLSQGWYSEYIAPMLEGVSLEPFTIEEANDYLTKRGVLDERTREVILKLSQCMPILLSLLSQDVPANPEEVGDPTGDAIDRFLKWIKDEEQHDWILSCALPHKVDRDVVKVLFPEQDADEIFEFVRNMDFVSAPSSTVGWVYHSLIRDFMLRYRLSVSREQWSQQHHELARYYERQRDELGLTTQEGIGNDEWQQLDIAVLYHTLCARGLTARDEWIGRMLKSYLQSSIVFIQAIARAVREAGEVLNSFTLVAQGEALSLTWQAWEARDFEATLPFFNELLSISNDLTQRQQATIHHMCAYALFGLLRFEEARDNFSCAIKLEPAEAWHHHWRGVTFFELEEYEAARDDFTRAIDLDPVEAWHYHWRGSTFLKRKEYQAAHKDFTHAIELEPEEPWHYYWRGVTSYECKEYEAACADFACAINLRPEDAVHHHWQGKTFHQLEQYETARADFTRAIELEPAEAWHYNRRGITFFELEEYEAAHDDFTRAIELEPAEAWHYNKRGWTLLVLMEHKAARDDFTHAVELGPEQVTHYYGRALSHLALGNVDDALKDLEYLEGCDSGPVPDLHDAFWRGVAHCLKEQNDDATLAWKQAIERAETSSLACISQRIDARLALLENNPVVAQQWYHAAITHCGTQSVKPELGLLRFLGHLFPANVNISTVTKWLEEQLEK